MKVEFNNLYIHFVLTTLNRFPFIETQNRIRIEKYITGIAGKSGSRLYAIYANPEHIHLLVSKSPQVSEEYFLGCIAASAENFIINNKLASGKFAWQTSAAAFSVSKSNVNKVCKYILNQAIHHRKKTFEEEYNSFMQFYQHNLTEQ